MYGSGILPHGPSGFRAMSCMILAIASMFSSFNLTIAALCTLLLEIFLARSVFVASRTTLGKGAEQCLPAPLTAVIFWLLIR